MNPFKLLAALVTGIRRYLADLDRCKTCSHDAPWGTAGCACARSTCACHPANNLS